MLLNNKYEYNPKTDLLGIGGFGRVYKARNLLLDKEVALKMVTMQGASAQYNLVEEVKKTFDLGHPNIIRYYDVFTLRDTNSIGEETETQVGVMEYIPDGDISQLDWNNLPQEQQKDILLQILDGLNYLHQNKIIHRDIKPSNILIKKKSDRITPKITDFGISKSQDAASVSLSRVIGSIPYMAPEQFDSKGRLSYNTDFWSLGILVYRLFTGVLPFGDERTTSEGVIMKNIMEMPLPEEVQQIPMPFRSLVEHCLVKDRRQRIIDAKMLMEALSATGTSQELVFDTSQLSERPEVYNKEYDKEEKTNVFREAGINEEKEEQKKPFAKQPGIGNQPADKQDNRNSSQLKGTGVKSDITLGFSIIIVSVVLFFIGYSMDRIFFIAPIGFIAGAFLFFKGLLKKLFNKR